PVRANLEEVHCDGIAHHGAFDVEGSGLRISRQRLRHAVLPDAVGVQRLGANRITRKNVQGRWIGSGKRPVIDLRIEVCTLGASAIRVSGLWPESLSGIFRSTPVPDNVLPVRCRTRLPITVVRSGARI